MPGLWSTRFSLMPSTPKRNVRIPQGTQQQCLVAYTDINPDLGLQVLDSVITTRWKVLPRDQCQGW